MRALFHVLAATLLWLGGTASAWAAVTITFWSHELGNSFPHAFVTLRGVPDAGGAAVDGNWGFTAKAITPAILMGSVAGKVDSLTPFYIRNSDAQFSVVLSDAQYADVLRLMQEWGEGGDSHYNLNTRNCVTFVQEAARRSGLSAVVFPKLMKKPRSFLQAVSAANPERVTVHRMRGAAYLAGLPPLQASPALAAEPVHDAAVGLGSALQAPAPTMKEPVSRATEVDGRDRVLPGASATR